MGKLIETENEEEELFERLAKLEAKVEYHDIQLEELEKMIKEIHSEDE
jgi:hypothetical protein